MRKTKKSASTERCAGPCGRALPPSGFPASPKLLGGRSPWCARCLKAMRGATGDDASVMRAEYHKAYLRSYQAARRAPMRARAVVRCEDEGWTIDLTRIVRTGRVRASGPWKLLDVAGDIIRQTFRCDPASVAEHGEGGGTGRRTRWRRS